MMQRVLVIDDNLKFLTAFAKLLELHRQAKLIGATTNVNEGLLLAAENSPDLVFIDVNMPRQNGFKVAQCMSELCPNARLVIMSFNDFPFYRQQAFASGVTAFVCKNDLVTMLPLLLDGKRTTHPA